MNKWLLISAMTLMAPGLFATKHDAAPNDYPPKKRTEDPNARVPYDADLFRKDAQVYSGHAELLVWAVSEGALDYANKMQHNVWGPSTSYSQGSVESATYNVDPGFRVALSYFRATHYWEVKWQYTRLTSRGDNTVEKPSVATKYLTGTWPQVVPNPLSQATSHLHLNYNVFDWLITRVFLPNPHLRFRIIGGTFAGWMDQDWKVRYTDTANNSTTIRNKWHFVGGGLKTGAMVDWYWTGDLYMTGLASLGALIGSYSNHAQQTSSYQPDALDNTAVPLRDASLYDTRGVFTTQFLLGPSWQKNYTKCRIELFAGFEANLWFNLQEIYRSTGSTSPFAAKETWMSTGMLALYGLTVRLTGDF